MFSFIGNFRSALGLLFRDKLIMLYSLIPIIIGILIYSLLGTWLYGDVLDAGRKWISSSFSGGALGEFFFYIFAGLMTIGLYFLINWTFVILVSLVACPFNDLISSRVEKVLSNPSEIGSDDGGIKKMLSRIGKIIINELKKITFILLLTILSLVFSVFGFVPVSFILSAILLAVAFVDYCWSRHDFTFGECVGNYKKSLFAYTFSGIVFMFLMSIPFLNLIMLPYAIVYFSYVFTKKRIKA